MAKVTVIEKRDDFTGATFDKGDTFTYSFEGVEYEIDLNSKNAAQFRKTMGRYVAASRKVKRTVAVSAPRAGRKARANKVKEVREWAASHGHEVKARGRIPAEIMKAYEEANA